MRKFSLNILVEGVDKTNERHLLENYKREAFLVLFVKTKKYFFFNKIMNTILNWVEINDHRQYVGKYYRLIKF